MQNKTEKQPEALTILPEVREYLKAKALAELLEEFVADCIANRPQDVLSHMELWAHKKRGNCAVPEAGPLVAEEDGDASDDGKEEKESKEEPPSASDAFSMVAVCWETLPDKKALVKLFLDFLLIQHASLRASSFHNVDLDVLSDALAQKLTLLFQKQLDDNTIVTLAKDYVAPRNVTSRTFVYCVTAFLSALQYTLKGQFSSSLASAWKQVLEGIADAVKASILSNENQRDDDAEKDATVRAREVTTPRGNPPAATSSTLPPRDVALESWKNIQNPQEVITTCLQMLLLQHPTLKRTVLEGVADTKVLVPLLTDKLSSYLAGQLQDGDMKEIAAAAGEARCRLLEPRHYDYFITALLMALSVTLKDGFAVVAEAWRRTLVDLTLKIQKVIGGTGP